MHLLLRKSVTVLAIYAVALNLLFLGFGPIAASADPADPFFVICHSAAPGGETPGKPGLIPGHGCEHCNVCNAIAAPPAPDVVLIVRLALPRLLHVLSPAPTRSRAGLVSDPRLARGPPRLA